jgi:hypothetical protein
VTGEWAIVNTGFYSPTSSQILSFFADTIWADGTTIIPTDRIIKDWDCPFDEDKAETFEKGRILVICI